MTETTASMDRPPTPARSAGRASPLNFEAGPLPGDKTAAPENSCSPVAGKGERQAQLAALLTELNEAIAA